MGSRRTEIRCSNIQTTMARHPCELSQGLVVLSKQAKPSVIRPTYRIGGPSLGYKEA